MSYERVKKYRYLKNQNSLDSSKYILFINVIFLMLSITGHDSNINDEIHIVDVSVPDNSPSDQFSAEALANEYWSPEVESDCNQESCDEEDISTQNDAIFETSGTDNSDLTSGSLQLKIKNWALRNIQTLTQKSIDEILMVLRSEGYTSIPKCTKTLLGTSCVNTETKLMRSRDDTMGDFKYFGVSENLSNIIDPNEYKQNDIQLLIHVDGMDVFNKSRKGFWSIIRSHIPQESF